MTELKQNFAIINGELCVRQQIGPFAEYRPVEGIRKSASPFVWTEPRIPWLMWKDICAFFRQSYKRVESESLCWLYYSPELKQWAWMVPYQKTSGMSVRVEPDERNTVLRSSIHPSYIQIGSIHDHCRGNAFQSGTDHGDEQGFDGVHITLGKLNEQNLDTHCRVVLNKRFADSHVVSWICMPAELMIIPDAPLRLEVFGKMLSMAGFGAPEVPKEVLERVQKPVYNHGHSQGQFGYYSQGNGAGVQGQEHFRCNCTPIYETKIAGKTFMLGEDGRFWMESTNTHPASKREPTNNTWFLEFDPSFKSLLKSDEAAATIFLDECENYLMDMERKVAINENKAENEGLKVVGDDEMTPKEKLSQTSETTPESTQVPPDVDEQAWPS